MTAAIPSLRYESLDALRGIAAVTVLISHLTPYGLMSDLNLWAALKWLPGRIAWGGHQAVILFFVLSGFSLYLMMERVRDLRSLCGYVVSRVARLYPPYVASLLMAAGVHWMTSPSFALEAQIILAHLAMIGDFDFNVINPPIWSIIHEMRISLVFPLIFYAALRWPRHTIGLTVTLSVTLGIFLWFDSNIAWLNMAGLVSTAMSAHYATMFAAGAVMARFRNEIVSAAQGGWSIGKTSLMGVALCLYMYPFDNPWNLGQRFIGDIAIMFGAILIMGLAMAHAKPLSTKPLRLLGRISFSLYLTHHSCITVAIFALGGKHAVPGAIWITSLMLSFPTAYLMYALVEQPTQKLGRRLRTTLA